MNSIFVGGPGRSGTSVFAASLIKHPQCTGFDDIELKIFSEQDGVRDLYYILCEAYSPPRAKIAIERFVNVIEDLIKGTYGQPVFDYQVANAIRLATANFIRSFEKETIIIPCTSTNFKKQFRKYYENIMQIAAYKKRNAKWFLEKTPHNSLNFGFISELFPDACLFHIIRDPRMIALSLARQTWGPNNLTASIEWVRAYFQRWKEINLVNEKRVIELKIEDLTKNRFQYSKKITNLLMLEEDSDLFSNFNEEMLTIKKVELSASDARLLDYKLHDLVEELGYPISDSR